MQNVRKYYNFNFSTDKSVVYSHKKKISQHVLPIYLIQSPHLKISKKGAGHVYAKM